MSRQISESEKIKALNDLTSIKNVKMDFIHLVDDINLVAEHYNDSGSFARAISQTCHHLSLLVNDKIYVSDLEDDYKDYKSCHYQSRRAKGQKADMRIVYKREGDKILVKGFGNRWHPEKIYRRLATRLEE